MNNVKIKPFFAAMLIAGGLSSHAYANTTATEGSANTDQVIKKINARTASLENEVKQLRKQLILLKKQENKHAQKQAAAPKKLAQQTSSKKSKQYLIELGATPVVSSPYIGIRSQYDASDLIVNIPSYNQDLTLLKHQQKMENELTKKGLTIPTTPLVELSGKVEGQVSAARGLDGNRSSNTDLSGSELDITAQFSPWLTAFLALSYDNNGPNASNGFVGNTVTRTDNSRIFLNKGWVTIGNLQKSPLYLTIGQRYHFGQYSSFMVSSPLTQLMTRIKARSLLLGYQHPNDNGVYGTLYTFKGDSNIGNSHINQIGATLGYEFTNNVLKADVGVDYINNIADAQGMQSISFVQNSALMGFGFSPAFERLVYRVPGAAAHIKLGYGPFSFVTEYTGATKRFDIANLRFNDLGARPQAFNIESAYMFKVLNKPANFALGYGQTKEAVQLNLPQRRYTATFNVSPWKDTIASVEFKREASYNPTDSGSLQSFGVISKGGFTNTLTAQFGVYF